MASPIQPVLDFADKTQQRFKITSVIVGVIKKYGDDRGSSLAALITYYTFVALFPLMLLSVTVLGVVLKNYPSLRADILDSAIADFPIIGKELTANLGKLQTHGVSTLIGVAGLAWGSLGFAQAAQTAMADVWNVPMVDRPSWFTKVRSAASAVLLLSVAIGASSALVAANVPWLSDHADWLLVIFAVIIDAAVFVPLFKVLTPNSVKFKDLWPGALLAGALFAVLITFGAKILAATLKKSSELYGFFGIVLGLLALLSLIAQSFVYSAEWNVVRSRKLYPRTLFGEPTKNADEQVFTDKSVQTKAVERQEIDVNFSGSDQNEDSH